LAVFYRDENGLSSELTNLFEEHGARCHWGKHVDLSPHHLRRQFPNWDEFRVARRRLDPAGTLSNAYTRRLAL
jgi:L-gulonolactone oxidase